MLWLVRCVLWGLGGGGRGTSPLSRGRLILSLRYPQGSQSVVVSGRVSGMGPARVQVVTGSLEERSATSQTWACVGERRVRERRCGAAEEWGRLGWRREVLCKCRCILNMENSVGRHHEDKGP